MAGAGATVIMPVHPAAGTLDQLGCAPRALICRRWNWSGRKDVEKLGTWPY